MLRVIGGTILGFWLSGLLNSVLGEIGLHEYSFYYNYKFDILLAVICALLGGYIGSKFNQHYVKQLEVGRVMNKNAQYAGKSIAVSIFLFLFVLSMADVSGAKGIGYVYLLAFIF